MLEADLHKRVATAFRAYEHFVVEFYHCRDYIVKDNEFRVMRKVPRPVYSLNRREV